MFPGGPFDPKEVLMQQGLMMAPQLQHQLQQRYAAY